MNPLDKSLMESKKAVMFLIVLGVSVALFVFSSICHVEVMTFLERVWDGLMVYLGAQSGQDMATRLAQSKIQAPQQQGDRYADNTISHSEADRQVKSS